MVDRDGSSTVATLSKLDIATAQLNTAIALYLDDKDLISAITLAGAAEEILGKLAEKVGTPSAFNETLDRLCAMHEVAFAEKPDRAAYVKLKTLARNELKHIGSHPELNLDLEREAVSVLRRAIKNFRVHDPAYKDLFRQFEQELVKRNDARQRK